MLHPAGGEGHGDGLGEGIGSGFMVGGGGSDGISSSLVASTTGPSVESIMISWQVLDTKSSMVMVHSGSAGGGFGPKN